MDVRSAVIYLDAICDSKEDSLSARSISSSALFAGVAFFVYVADAAKRAGLI
jgi:hypothetical protein